MTTVNLDHLAALQAEYDSLVAEAKRLTEAADALKAHIQHEMGEAEVATIGGKPAFTWKRTGQFNQRRFATEHPDLYAQYTVLRPVVDTDKLAAEVPEVFERYRARRFERKG